MSDLFPAGAHPEDYELYGVRARDGHVQIRVDPSLPDEKPHYKWSDPRIQAIADLDDYDREDVPVRRDYTEDAPPCERCGSTDGVQYHHVAPREFFEDEAESWPKIQVCRACHERWHRAVEEYWREVSRQALAFVDLNRRDPRPWKELFEFWCHTKDFPGRYRDQIYQVVKKTIEAET